MRHDEAPFDPDVEVLIEQCRTIQPMPDVVRARSLARARAAIVAAVTPHPEPIPTRWRRVLPLALAASLVLGVGTASALVALHRRVPPRLVPVPPVRSAVAPSARAPVLASPPPAPPVAPPSDSTVKPRRAERPSQPQESYAAELNLLQRAQVAYAGREFSNALALVAEHRRRFPNGRLTEEREALRVRSLAGAGRTDEAARAAAQFADRFPRSVLLPRFGTQP